jgi:small subunit ribosomal protein S2
MEKQSLAEKIEEKKQLAKQYVKASVHYGHNTKEWNPKMANYILSEKFGYHVIDLVKTVKFLRLAGNVVEKKAAKGHTFLFVGTTRVSSSVVAIQAKKVNAFYINYRWLGGTLTNWPTLKKRIQKLEKLEADQAAGNLEKLPRKEYNRKRKELEKLRRSFNGIKNMKKLPDLVIFTNQLKDLLAIEECRKLGIPVICLVDTNCDPDLIPYPIPANDDSTSSINFILTKLTERIENGYAIYEKKKMEKLSLPDTRLTAEKILDLVKKN